MPRDYSALLRLVGPAGDRRSTMNEFVDAAWEILHPTGVSWLGFYLYEGGDELLLGPRRDKPACSPIGLHGVCGQAFREGRAIIVHDVRALGAHYVACDPRDLSELVVPLFNDQGECDGVLDLDSFEIGAFSTRDASELHRALAQACLTAQPALDPPRLA